MLTNRTSAPETGGADAAGAGAPPAPGVAALAPAQAPAGPAVPWADTSKFVDGVFHIDGKPWYDAHPDPAVAQFIGTKRFADPNEAIKAYTNLARMHDGAKDVIPLPPENATAEQIQDYYKRRGALDSPDQYEFKFEDGKVTDPHLVQFGKAVAHKLGLTPQEAQTLANEWEAFLPAYKAQQTDVLKTAAEENAAKLEQFKSSYKGDFQADLAAGQAAYKSLGLDADSLAAIESHIGAVPLVELFLKLGKARGEGSLPSPAVSNTVKEPSAMTPAEAQAEISRVLSTKEEYDAYKDPKHPRHQALVTHVMQLHERLGA